MRDNVQGSTRFTVEQYFIGFEEWLPIAEFLGAGFDEAVDYCEYKKQKKPDTEFQVVEYKTTITTTRKAIER